MIRPNVWNDAVNEYWKQRSLTDDEFYFGLGDRIKRRQEAAIPVAGEGTVQFLQFGGGLISGVAYFVPVLRPVSGLYNRALEQFQLILNEEI